MRALTETDVRASFVNATEEELETMEMPHDFLFIDWDFRDFFAWRDPVFGKRGYVIVETAARAVGIVLRASESGRAQAGMCNICRTMQPGAQVALFTARRADSAGSRGDSIGTHMCVDLSCHDNVRLAPPLAPNEIRPAGQVDMRLDGTRRRMEAFVARVQENPDVAD
ncbi:FBP domain-containing protein [uncultured Microbacterium sp.]|uniref:FBP domain-containing protein n=1 Tax=uncultured Microbacterium sp. TaxID=191216 RepID=UPI00260666E2|nr:FBP domain-containing protein [uncultured Microbacterium sp.]